MGLFSRLFGRAIPHKESAYPDVYAAVVACLSRTGVKVGRTAGYPRVEVHTITEGERMDKAGSIRQLSLTVESIGNASLAATAAMNEENIDRMLDGLSLSEDWNLLGVIPGQLSDLTESSDTAKIIYRLLQTFTIVVERLDSES